MIISPMAGHLFLERVEVEETKSAIVLPDSVDKKETRGGKIVAIADYRIDQGQRHPMYLGSAEGKYGFFKEHTADVFSINGRLFFSVHEDDMIATVPDLETFQQITFPRT